MSLFPRFTCYKHRYSGPILCPHCTKNVSDPTDPKPDAAALLSEARELLWQLSQNYELHFELPARIYTFLAAPAASSTNDLPAIGQPFDGGIYAGLSLEGNKPVALVLLPGEAEEITWNKALIWAEEQGGVLPSRTEALQLFLRLKVEFKEAVYWTADQPAGYESYAWGQNFDWGSQDYWPKVNELRARAVRRVPLSVEEAPLADSTCPLCKGTGKREVTSFQDSSKTRLQTCGVCKGFGRLGNVQPADSVSVPLTLPPSKELIEYLLGHEINSGGEDQVSRWIYEAAKRYKFIVTLATSKPDEGAT